MEVVANARAHKLDVWRLSAIAVEGAVMPTEEIGKDIHGARPLVCNYLSIGADAYVELRFNQLRWDHPEKYKSRMGNFRAHAHVGFKYMIRRPSRKIHVADHIEQMLIDNKQIDIPENLQAIIFLNIPSYGAGLQPWGTIGIGQSKWSDVDRGRNVRDMYVDDQQFEVIGLRNLTQFGMIKLFGAHGIRLAQGRHMQLTLKSDVSPFQVDGEPWEQRGGMVTLEPGNRVGILEGPEWTETSKKNASFEPNHLADDPAAPPGHVNMTEQ